MAGSILLIGAGPLLGTTSAGAAGGQGDGPPQYVVAAEHAAAASTVVDPGLPGDDEATGLVHRGLALGRSGGPCDGLLEAVLPDGSSHCTHGPDAAPKGVDVRRERSVEDLALATAGSSAVAGTTGGTVPCYGDGVSGNRVQAVYARSSDKPDRYSSIAPLIPQWAATADAVFNNSAAKTGGVRHIRWVTNSDCSLSVLRVTLSPTGDDSMANTTSELQSLGIDGMNRKFMVWVDANVYCGVGDIRYDDQPGDGNMNNYGRSWARVDSGCWGYFDSPEAHEIMHMMGGVQPTAPHSTGAWHCTDESDRMCYQDGPVSMTYPCASADEVLFDCGNDDYFHTSPSPTSYLGTHWNAAMNLFLERTGPAAPTGTTTTTTPATTTTTTMPAATTATSSWNGQLKGNSLSKSYGASSGSGTLVASSTYTGGGSSVTVEVRNSAGTVVGQRSGPSGFSLSVTVPSGSYTVTISGSKNTSYTLTVTRPT